MVATLQSGVTIRLSASQWIERKWWACTMTPGPTAYHTLSSRLLPPPADWDSEVQAALDMVVLEKAEPLSVCISK